MPLSPIDKAEMDLFDKVISTNLRGAFLVLAQALQHVASGGRIIAFSSSVLAKSFPTYGPYIAAKAGVEGLVHVLANELRGRNVTVNAVAPGPVATELFLKGKSEEQIAGTEQVATAGTPGTAGRYRQCRFLFGRSRWCLGELSSIAC
jgi:3-oxoacyl-[acyl-carrier protein] reductase